MTKDSPSPARKAEAAALGSILIDPPRIKIATKLGLEPSHFTDPMLGAVYSAAIESHRTRRTIDPVLLATSLRDNPLFSNEPASAVIMQVSAETPTSANAEHYIEAVVEAARKQLLHDLAGQLSYSAQNGKSSREIIHEIGSTFDDLRRYATGEPLLADAVPMSQFAAADHRIEYLIPGVIVAGQPGVISAKSKSLKTTIALDACISMATGSAFLNHWAIPEPMPCGIISAESGAATLAETIHRICRSKGVDPAELSTCYISTRCPRLQSAEWLDEIRRFIEANDLRCLKIDPTYLALAGINQNNLADVAAALAPIGAIVQETGCSIIMVHHNRKVTAAAYGCPTLEEITGSGFAEWSRFWILLGKRREWDEETGEHALWLVAGGSAGFGSRKWLHAREGRQLDIGGRVWEVEVVNASEREREEKQSAAREREQEREAKATERERAVVDAMRKLGGQATKTAIAERMGVGAPTIVATLASLQDNGTIRKCRIKIPPTNREGEGYEFSDS